MRVVDRTPEYHTWMQMRDRCNNPNNNHYYRYGSRGIKVCRRWDNFKLFLADMGLKPTPDHSIERKNNDKGYSPSNCVWATSGEQARNTSRNVFITYRGKRLTLQDWAPIVGIGHETLQHRIYAGWPIELAFTAKPPYHQRRHNPATKPVPKMVTYRGKKMTVPQWSRNLGIPLATIHGRLYRGWNAEKALGTRPRTYKKKAGS